SPLTDPTVVLAQASLSLAEQVPGNAGEVGAHRRYSGVRVACPEGGDDRLVVFLVEIPPLPGRAAALEVAPDLSVPCRFHDAVERGEQRAVRGGDDAPVKRQVPSFEFLVAGGL